MSDPAFLERKFRILVDHLCKKGILVLDELPESFFDEDLVDDTLYRCPYCQTVGKKDSWEYKEYKPYCGESCSRSSCM